MNRAFLRNSLRWKESWISLEKEKWRTGAPIGPHAVLPVTASYFFLMAFSAAFVTLPELGSLKLTDLMTPTATVCLISRTAKRPRGGNSENASTHMGLEGTKLTMAASPDLILLGFSSVVLPGNNERNTRYHLFQSDRERLSKKQRQTFLGHHWTDSGRNRERKKLLFIIGRYS